MDRPLSSRHLSPCSARGEHVRRAHLAPELIQSRAAASSARGRQRGRGDVFPAARRVFSRPSRWKPVRSGQEEEEQEEETAACGEVDARSTVKVPGGGVHL